MEEDKILTPEELRRELLDLKSGENDPHLVSLDPNTLGEEALEFYGRYKRGQLTHQDIDAYLESIPPEKQHHYFLAWWIDSQISRKEIKEKIEVEVEKGRDRADPNLLKIRPDELSPTTLQIWGNFQRDKLTREEAESFRRQTDPDSPDGWLSNYINNKLTAKMFAEVGAE